MKWKVLNAADDYNVERAKTGMISPAVSFRNRKYIPFGKNNLAPNEFVKLGREVVNHRAILNSKVRYINGSDLVSDDGKSKDFLSELHITNGRFLYDEFAAGNVFVEIVTDGKKTYLKIFHIESTKCRINRAQNGIIFNPDWSARKVKNDKEIPFYPLFKKGDDGQFHSVYWKKQYEPEFVNGLPLWFAGLKSVNISKLTNEVNEKRLENGYMKDGILLAPIESTEDQKLLQDKINKQDSGAENAGGITVSGLPTGAFGDDSIPKPEFIDLRMSLKGMFMDLHNNASDELVRVHEWYRALSGFNDNTGFDTNRINSEYQVALSTSIIPKQNEYLKIYTKILSDFGYNTEGLRFINNNPVNNINIKIQDLNILKKEFGIGEFDLENPMHIKLFDKIF